MTTQAESAYDALVDHWREQALVASCQELLVWDELTRLPDGAMEYRGRQIAYLAGKHHQLATDPRIGEWLDLAERSPLAADPLSDTAVNLREARRQYDRLMRLPRALVEELARLVTAAQHEWKLAREVDDFRRFQPWLARMVLRKREEALCLSTSSEPYDAMLGEYETGFSTADVSALFAALARELPALLVEVLALQTRARRPARPALLRREYAPERQREFCSAMAATLGFDLAHGAIGTSIHPFTSLLGPGDCRIALRFCPRDLREGIFGSLHEIGHALYDQGLPPEHYGTPLGEPASLSIHESQGRLWENAVGKSLGFWQHFLPQLARLFPVEMGDASADDVWRAVNFVEPSLNRVRADDVTYNLHVLIRFELERALLTGDLPVADLPAAWNERYQAHLGMTPQGPREGCLQDGHWAAGMFGYFPTYTIGNLAAAQLLTQAERDLGPTSEQFARGDFATLRTWLSSQVFRHGKRFSTAELVRRTTGQALDYQPLLDGLRARHRELWQ
ncbi:MAG: carboxypeptidase M32 [Planctomycetaceae bacterium]|nr:carboxypeptidase M32 [Planctomycetaceae bacterium]